MSDYRHNRVPGGTYFLTVNLLDRRSNLLVEHIDALREAVRMVRAKRPFHIDGWVVLPDHMHCIWTLPEGYDDYPSRWKAIKTAFSKATSTPKAWFGIAGGRLAAFFVSQAGDSRGVCCKLGG
jgi:putative transposase